MRKIVLIVPDALDKVDIKTSIKVRVEVARRLSAIFGGYTEITGQGGWVNDDGALAQETVTQFVSYDDAILDGLKNKRLHQARELAEYVRRELDQESVLLAVEPVNLVDFV